MRGLSKAVSRIQDFFRETRDVFNDDTAKTTTNESNLAGHYPYSPERWRLFTGSVASGNRLFPEYEPDINDLPEYTHAGDYHRLQPAGGETVIFETAERYRYTVQYELEATWAWAINQPLQGDDYVRCGFYDGTDGWFLEHNGGHATDEVAVVVLRDGTEQYREVVEVYKGGFQTNTRFALDTAWYDVTRQQWEQSYSEDGLQRNKTIARVSNDDSRGPKKGNQPLRYEVQADAGTTGLELEAGSTALITKGSGGDNFRGKTKAYTDTLETTDAWVPLRAYREDPSKDVINNQLLSFSILGFGGQNKVEGTILAFDETSVTFTGTDSWDAAPIWNDANNSMQVRSDVDQFADSTGTLVSTVDDPGGHQIGYSVLAPATGNKLDKGASETGIGVKRNLPNGDVAVLLANSTDTGDLTHGESWEQDW